MKTLCIKVDVDTAKGMARGVPVLIDIFGRLSCKATFYIALGPDNSGKAIRRVFTRKGFLKKMLRTRAASVYGFPTILYGTILPAPLIAEKNKEIFSLLRESGQEIGIHGYDHVKWHDKLDCMTEEEIAEELEKASQTFQDCTGQAALTFAAPGWSWNEKAQSEIDKLGITYTSNTRGRYPFFPVYGDKKYKALEIPTTLPTLDEIMGESVKDISELSRYYLNLIHDQGESVLTIHAELEGMVYSEWFSSFMTMLQKEKIQVLSLGEYAAQKLNEAGNISSGKICKKIIEGRAGYVASQKG